MSKYSRNVGETPAQFNARIKVAEAALAERLASSRPNKLNPEKSRLQVARDIRRSEDNGPNDGGSASAPNFRGIIPAPPRSPRGSGTNDGGPNNAPTSGPFVPGRVKTPVMPKEPARPQEPARPMGIDFEPMRGDAPRKGVKAPTPIEKAAGGAAKVRKGMMSPEGKILHAMNKIRGK